MIAIFIPDSVADPVHERTAPVTFEAGLKQATFAALAADAVNIVEDDVLTKGYYKVNASYTERDGCGVIRG